MKALRALIALSAFGLGSLGLAEPEGALYVSGIEGTLRLLRFETEPWPLEAGQALPDNSRVELDAGAKLRLRFEHYLDLALVGPARLTVYVVPSPIGGGFEEDRVVLKLDEGSLLVDGRFQFGRPADLLLSLPDRSLLCPKDQRFVAQVASGSSALFLPLTESARAAWPAQLSGTALQAVTQGKPLRGKAAFDQALFDELERPVKVFVIARDFNQDLGIWPKPAVLGPLLTERLSKLKGLTVVEGSGDTFYAYQANTALKSGQDFFIREMALARGARWVVIANGVALTPPQAEAPYARRVQGQAEARLIEAEGDGLELVSEVGDTRVARAGRPLVQASREAMEAAADEVAGHLSYHLTNLVQGHAHTEVLLKLVLENANSESVKDLRTRLAGMDSVQRVFRRAFTKGLVSFDVLLRKDIADFDGQWQQQPAMGWAYEPLAGAAGERRFRARRQR